MAKFKILHGQHAQKEPTTLPDGTVIQKQVMYKKGDIVESQHNLAARFNSPPDSIKFEPIYEGPKPSVPTGPVQASRGTVVGDKPLAGLTTPAPSQPTPIAPASDTLEHMTVKELQTLAADEEIDLKGATNKDQILKVLRGPAPVPVKK